MSGSATFALAIWFFVSVPAGAWISGGLDKQTQAQKPAPSVTDRQMIETAMESYATALRTGTPTEVAALFDVEGELQLPGLAALHGRDAIREFLAPLTAAMEVDAVSMQTVLLDVHGTSADHWGTYKQIAGERGKAKQQFHGRYAAIWQKNSDGHWRLLRLMMQPLPADSK